MRVSEASAAAEYGLLLDPTLADATEPVVRLELPMSSSLDECQEALAELLAVDPVETVSIVVGATVVGSTSRTHLLGGGYVTPDMRGPGDADHLTLPGGSSRYRLIRFRCPGCERRVVRSFYDDRYRPTCPRHGEMVLQ
jgi:hypothetical protein